MLDAAEVVRDTVTADGKVSAGLLEANQTAAHGLAWMATYVEALRQMQAWAERLQKDGKFGEIEQLMQKMQQTRSPAVAEALARKVGASKGSFYWHFKGLPDFHQQVAAAWNISM